MQRARARLRTRGAVAAALASTVALVGGTLVAADAADAADAGSVTVSDPGTPAAGDLTLHGSVSAGTTSVVFVVDTSGSTSKPTGLDCDGDGTAGQPGDNLNGDPGQGDILDCEIGAVRTMARTLSSSAGQSQVGLETFGMTADARDLDPATAGDQLLVPANAAGTDGTLLESAVVLLHRDQTGTVFDPAVHTALTTLSKAPAGERFVILLTDGRGHADQSTIDALESSGVRLRAFSVGNTDGCSVSSDLRTLATVTGEACRTVTSPATLSSALADAPPPTISAVQVAINGHSFPATVDIAGGWHLPVQIGAGSYTATAKAFFTDGTTATSTPRSFVVGRNDTAKVPDGTVQGAGATRTDVLVNRPPSTLAELPTTVRGRVGTLRAGQTPGGTDKLSNAVVQIQGRGGSGDAWVSLGSARVQSTGAFTLRRGAAAGVHQLRVALLPFQTYSSAVRSVPRPGISGCRITRSGTRFAASCHTVAGNGHAVRLLRSGHVVQRTKVTSGLAKVAARGRPTSYVLTVKAGPGSWYRLRL